MSRFSARSITMATIAILLAISSPAIVRSAPAPGPKGPFLPITLPSGTPDDSLASAAWRARVLDPIIAARAAGRGLSDAIVLLSHADGTPASLDARLVPERPDVQANALRFTFDSPALPWTGEETARLEQWIADLYPVAIQVYGAPAHDIAVNIRKVASPSLNWYSPVTNEIGLVGGGQPVHVLCHEMLHAFRDNAMIASGVYEEGMASAGTAAVMKHLDAYSSSNERHAAQQSYYEVLNRRPIADWGGGISYGPRFQLRYDMSDYAWTKLVLISRTFLADFNRAYYGAIATAGVPFWGPDEVASLREIARSLTPTVEGVAFDVWYDRQHILNVWPAQGVHELYQSQIDEDAVSTGTIAHLFRRESGVEFPIANTPVRFQAFDHSGRQLRDLVAGTEYNGLAWFKAELPADVLPYTGLIQVIVSAETPQGVLADTTYRSHGRAGGLFGVVIGALEGEVTAMHLSTGVTERTTLTHGCFDLPSLEMIEGTFRVSFRGVDGREASCIVSKDISPYFVPLHAGPPPQAANFVANPAFDAEHHRGWDPYHGSELRLAAGGRGETGYCLEVQGPATSEQFGTNDHPNWVRGTLAGHRYRFSAWVSAPSPSGTSRLRVREYLNKVRVGNGVYSNRVALSGSWQRLVVEFTARSKGSWLDLQVVSDPDRGNTAFRIDDVSIEHVSPLGPLLTDSTSVDETDALAADMADDDAVAVPEARPTVTLIPSPMRETSELCFTTSRPGPLAVDLYDLHGRHVRRLMRAESAAAGAHRVVVARRDATGIRIPAGICFYRIVAAGGAFGGRIVVID